VSAQLEGRIAIVTGAGTGIGIGRAIAVAADGACVVVNHLNTPELAEAVVAQITRDGGEAVAIAADVGRRAEYAAMVDATIDRFGSWESLSTTRGSAHQAARRGQRRGVRQQRRREREGLFQRMPARPRAHGRRWAHRQTSPVRRPA
jgi:NAD(P)-dependent dehydrogenase (short-subunit alcohol dehydrogenase family)